MIMGLVQKIKVVFLEQKGIFSASFKRANCSLWCCAIKFVITFESDRTQRLFLCQLIFFFCSVESHLVQSHDLFRFLFMQSNRSLTIDNYFINKYKEKIFPWSEVKEKHFLKNKLFLLFVFRLDWLVQWLMAHLILKCNFLGSFVFWFFFLNIKTYCWKCLLCFYFIFSQYFDPIFGFRICPQLGP